MDGKYLYEVELDGQTYLSAENNETKEFENVVVKAAEKTYGVLPGFLRNVFIEGKGRIIWSFFPLLSTLCQTNS